MHLAAQNQGEDCFIETIFKNRTKPPLFMTTGEQFNWDAVFRMLTELPPSFLWFNLLVFFQHCDFFKAIFWNYSIIKQWLFFLIWHKDKIPNSGDEHNRICIENIVYLKIQWCTHNAYCLVSMSCDLGWIYPHHIYVTVHQYTASYYQVIHLWAGHFNMPVIKQTQRVSLVTQRNVPDI